MKMELGTTMTCKNCLFWKQARDSFSPSGLVQTGECRAKAPAYRKRQSVGAALWPFTMAEEWCGDYKADRDTSEKLKELAKKEAHEIGKVIADVIRVATTAENAEDAN